MITREGVDIITSQFMQMKDLYNLYANFGYSFRISQIYNFFFYINIRQDKKI